MATERGLLPRIDAVGSDAGARTADILAIGGVMSLIL
jgi:hypothetical protein